ncbi:MAG: SDR family oxidoreductase [Dysgonomonas mossii]|uniref:SDR family oxidoreductase n=1 Tax=Dysgonomonas mossii TaxID=163665 RepID=UPI001E16F86B|nr:SDR family oxidoreductase [Dysgonomonas mossii]MBS5797459.1 SDR family oxidoreductase [Dysgonomonas mossii]MBS7112162.1 SDR family oxidoreductase [Dysgonomonas mossii]
MTDINTKTKQNIFSIEGKVAIVTGGYGVLGGSISRHLAEQGANVVILGRNEDKGNALVKEINENGGKSLFIKCDVMDENQLIESREKILSIYGKLDILVNAAGGNVPGATLAPDQDFYTMKTTDWEKVIKLNMDGTVFPSLIFSKVMAEQGSGNIINVSSMAAYSAISRVPGYSAAKAAISNFTQWMATEMALKYGDKIRVNAIAPGFFIGDQNRAVLINPDGSLTERSKKVLAKTPMGRFGDITELNGVVQFLCSDAASFITGVVLPVDGGFSAYSGV